MEAKDTWLSPEAIKEIVEAISKTPEYNYPYRLAQKVKEAQAEITWEKARKAGVQLAENQSLPECYEGNKPRTKAFRDMLKRGFKRVIKK